MKTAEDAYIDAHDEATRLVARIRRLVADLPAPHDSLRINWGQVGELGEVNVRLNAVVAFLEHSEQ